MQNDLFTRNAKANLYQTKRDRTTTGDPKSRRIEVKSPLMLGIRRENPLTDQRMLGIDQKNPTYNKYWKPGKLQLLAVKSWEFPNSLSNKTNNFHFNCSYFGSSSSRQSHLLCKHYQSSAMCFIFAAKCLSTFTFTTTIRTFTWNLHVLACPHQIETK